MPIGGTTHQIEVEGGRLIPIEFTVPSDGVVAVQVRGAAESGNGTISWWQGPTLQTPKPVSLDGRFYGFDGGEDGSSRINDDIDSRFYKSSRLTVPLYSTETIGATFRAMIRANPGSDLRGSVQIDLFGSQDLPFDSPMPFLVENHSKGDWRYFEIDVPEAAPVAWSVEIESIQDIDSDASRRGGGYRQFFGATRRFLVGLGFPFKARLGVQDSNTGWERIGPAMPQPRWDAAPVCRITVG